MVFGYRITEYMDKKITKAQQHNVRSMGTRQQRFEVACKDKYRRGVRRERVVQGCLLREDGITACTCHKPKLLHLPCLHVIAARAISQSCLHNTAACFSLFHKRG